MYPFSGLGALSVVSKIVGGERPARPEEGQKLGLEDPVWDMTLTCWQKDPVVRPKATGLVRFLRRWPVFSRSSGPTS